VKKLEKMIKNISNQMVRRLEKGLGVVENGP
jgi:hypothetical protein